MTELADAYQDHRPLLFSIAYRMLGSVTEAEDIVQEAFVRYGTALSGRSDPIESPRAYLSATTTRLAIDHLRSARTRREQYVGEWLPEPLLTDETALEGARYVEEADSLSMAFLLLLERLTPVERAVFLLHDVFDYGYDEVADIVGKSRDNCRQLATRARRHVHEGRPRVAPARERGEELARRFFETLAGRGDIDSLVEMLAADVVAYADGGGKVPAGTRPVYGPDKVGRLLRGLARMAQGVEVDVRHTEINGLPGALYLDSSGRLIDVMTVEIADGRIQTVRSVLNPDKLGHLGPPADLRQFIRDLAARRR